MHPSVHASATVAAGTFLVFFCIFLLAENRLHGTDYLQRAPHG
jgi:hypothetical protein